jgi:hypothetical protein
MRRSSNTRVAVRLENPPGVRTERQLRIVEMAALEQLPASVRFMLNELAINVAAWKTLAYYRSIERQARALGGSPFDAEVWTLRRLVKDEGNEQEVWAALYRDKHGHQLPHKGAAVSILRYGPTEPRGRVHSLARRGAGRIPMPPEIRELAA